jgi:G:T/U-mismatch repair DNA glycosylase
MASRKDVLPSHFQPQKRRRIEFKLEDKSSPDLSSSASFPNELIQSFSFKAERNDEQMFKEPRRSSRTVSTSSSITSAVVDVPDKKIKRQVLTKKDEVEYLPEVQDYVKEDMDILIIGSNPGRMSSRKGQHFSHPSNHFYKALHGSGLTPTRVPPSLDYTMLNQEAPFMSIGLTNLVARPTRMAQELNKTEEAVGTEILIDLIRRYRPKVGLFIGIGVTRGFERSLAQLNLTNSIKKEEEESSVTIAIADDIPVVTDKTLGLGVGLLKVGVRHSTGFTLLFAMPSTSGRVTTHQLKEKTECMAAARKLTSELEMEMMIDRQDVTVRLI